MYWFNSSKTKLCNHRGQTGWKKKKRKAKWVLIVIETLELCHLKLVVISVISFSQFSMELFSLKGETRKSSLKWFHQLFTNLQLHQKRFNHLPSFLFSLWFWLLICSLDPSIINFALQKFLLSFVEKSFSNFHVDHSRKFAEKSLWINENFIVSLFKWNLYIYFMFNYFKRVKSTCKGNFCF